MPLVATWATAAHTTEWTCCRFCAPHRHAHRPHLQQAGQLSVHSQPSQLLAQLLDDQPPPPLRVAVEVIEVRRSCQEGDSWQVEAGAGEAGCG